MMKKLFLLMCGLVSGYNMFAQTCSCSSLLNQVITKTESNYAGYIHNVKEKDSSQYVQLKGMLREKAVKTSFIDCYGVLQQYVGFFHDGHLDIFESPPKQPDSLAATVKTHPLPANYKELIAKKTDRDSIEGIWRAAGNLQLGIVKTGKNTFSGVVQQTSTPKWAPGMVKMEIEKTGKNTYNVAVYRGDFARLRFENVHIFKNVFLAMGLYRLAKAWPLNAEYSYINTVDPQLPILKVIDKNNVLLTVPSALIDGRYLDSVLIKNEALITSTPNLIIDVRGNGGGNYIWGGIYKIANTIVHPEPKKPGTDDLLLMASEDDAAYLYNQSTYYRQKKDSLAIKYYDDIIGKIRANPGKIIGFSFYRAWPDTGKRVVYKYPAHIAVITDKAVASAGEAFINGLKETSSKVTLYGDNTYGMIDYSSVNALPIGDKSCKWYYWGYPVFFSTDIKTKPINPTGIKPDIYIPAQEKDWVQWVADDLNKKSIK
ncbi:S41 family peptidase [Mucilaginibacter sp.]|uniref:S41 family peptidase n=1 Tax=Mucilaginibacter sp. TaxID=1882438 RepID=UPI0025EEE93B|nr:S41 family peptidase [Mucilaginibacter sp.]